MGYVLNARSGCSCGSSANGSRVSLLWASGLQVSESLVRNLLLLLGEEEEEELPGTTFSTSLSSSSRGAGRLVLVDIAVSFVCVQCAWYMRAEEGARSKVGKFYAPERVVVSAAALPLVSLDNMVYSVICPHTTSNNKQELVLLEFQGSFETTDSNIQQPKIGDVTFDNVQSTLFSFEHFEYRLLTVHVGYSHPSDRPSTTCWEKSETVKTFRSYQETEEYGDSDNDGGRSRSIPASSLF